MHAWLIYNSTSSITCTCKIKQPMGGTRMVIDVNFTDEYKKYIKTCNTVLQRCNNRTHLCMIEDNFENMKIQGLSMFSGLKTGVLQSINTTEFLFWDTKPTTGKRSSISSLSLTRHTRIPFRVKKTYSPSSFARL